MSMVDGATKDKAHENKKAVKDAFDKKVKAMSEKGINSERYQEVRNAIEEKQIKAKAMDKLPFSAKNHSDKSDNVKALKLLIDERDQLAPKTPTAFISDEIREKIEDAKPALMNSDLPIYSFGIKSETGELHIKVDPLYLKISEEDANDAIRALVDEDVSLDIVYEINTFKLQASNCNSNDVCNPIIGGAFVEDKYNGKECTASIAAVRGVWLSDDENGIILPHHCNPNTSDIYQADNDVTSEKVGKETKDGGWWCDCIFIKSDSRSIDTGKVYQGTTTDFVLSGNADAADETDVWLYGQTSGKKQGTIKEIGQSWEFPTGSGIWYGDLYKVEGISFTDGDSGAPMIDIGNTKYSGMNIGTDGTYQMVHEWSFLKSKLGLN
jgi:hypothetical protein